MWSFYAMINEIDKLHEEKQTFLEKIISVWGVFGLVFAQVIGWETDIFSLFEEITVTYQSLPRKKLSIWISYSFVIKIQW